MFLHEQRVGARWVHGDAVDAVAHLGVGVGDVFGVEAAVDGLPRLAAVVAPESARGRDGDEDAVGVNRVENDGVEAEAAAASLPDAGCVVLAQAGQFLPRLPAVAGAEDGRVFDAGVDRVWVVERRLKVPDAFEVPRVRRVVVPLVCARPADVGELVADGRPRLAAVVRAMDDLAEPVTGLRGVDAIGVGRRPFQMINLQPPKVRSIDVPLLALLVRCQNKRAFPCADQNSYAAHVSLLSAGVLVPGARLVKSRPLYYGLI